MNPRVTLGFVLALAVMAGLVVGLDRFNVGSPASASATATSTAGQNVQVFQFDDRKVTAAEVRAGDKTVRVTREGDTWKVADSGEPANRSSFSSLMVRMSQLKGTSRIEGATDLAQFGLDQPKDGVVAQLDDGSRYELLLGNKTPVQTGVYARKADSPDAYVIASQVQTDVERLVNDPKEPPTPTPRPATPTAEATPTPPADATATPAP